jgi:hypothetical protein
MEKIMSKTTSGPPRSKLPTAKTRSQIEDPCSFGGGLLKRDAKSRGASSPRPLPQSSAALRSNGDAAVNWPGAKITLRNGARIIEKTWPADD